MVAILTFDGPNVREIRQQGFHQLTNTAANEWHEVDHRKQWSKTLCLLL